MTKNENPKPESQGTVKPAVRGISANPASVTVTPKPKED